MLERQRQRVVAAVSPELEQGEQIYAVYMGQHPIPPISYVLIGPLLLFWMIKFKTLVATDRNLYVFPHKWMRSYSYAGPPDKRPVWEARYESGGSWARVDGGPKLYVMPFGPVKKGLVGMTDAVNSLQAHYAAHGYGVAR